MNSVDRRLSGNSVPQEQVGFVRNYTKDEGRSLGVGLQLRLVCLAGVSLVRVRIRSSIAWMAGMRETGYLKPIDKVSKRDVNKSPCHKLSERRDGPKNDAPPKAEFSSIGRRQHV